MSKYINAIIIQVKENLYDKAQSAVLFYGCPCRRLVHNYSRSPTRVSTLINLYSIFLERIMYEALDDHEGSVSNLRSLADDTVINTEEEEEEEADVLVDRLDVQRGDWFRKVKWW